MKWNATVSNLSALNAVLERFSGFKNDVLVHFDGKTESIRLTKFDSLEIGIVKDAQIAYQSVFSKWDSASWLCGVFSIQKLLKILGSLPQGVNLSADLVEDDTLFPDINYYSRSLSIASLETRGFRFKLDSASLMNFYRSVQDDEYQIRVPEVRDRAFATEDALYSFDLSAEDLKKISGYLKLDAASKFLESAPNGEWVTIKDASGVFELEFPITSAPHSGASITITKSPQFDLIPTESQTFYVFTNKIICKSGFETNILLRSQEKY
jgi:hypothetical protein